MSDEPRGPRPVPDRPRPDRPEPDRRPAGDAPAEDRELLGLVASLQAESPGPHPPPATLLAYRRGDLDGDAGRLDEVRDHLVTCAACRNVLLDLDDLDGAVGDAGEIDEGETSAGGDGRRAAAEAARAEEEWRRLLERLPAAGTGEAAGEAAEASIPTASIPEARRRLATPFSGHLGWWAAAALLLVCLGLGAQLARLGDVSPRGNVPVVYLDAVTRAGGGEVPVPTAGGGDDAAALPVVLIVAPPDPAAYPAYALELRGEGTSWNLEDLRPVAPYGTLRAVVPARAFAGGGALEVRLLGLPAGGGKAEALASYRLVVAAGGTGDGTGAER